MKSERLFQNLFSLSYSPMSQVRGKSCEVSKKSFRQPQDCVYQTINGRDEGEYFESFNCNGEALNALTAKFYEIMPFFRGKCCIRIFTNAIHVISPLSLIQPQSPDLQRINAEITYCG